MTDQVIVLSLAVVADLLLGEPPNQLHPVAWIGHLIAALERRAPSRGAIRQFCYGAALVAGVMALTSTIAFLILSLLANWNHWAYVIASAILFKLSFSLLGLSRAAQTVKMHLLASDIDSARRALRALVSRDTTRLGQGHIASAAIESVAENIVDSFVAPILFFVIFAWWGPLGPAAALMFRAANTCDAMIGYRGSYEYLGKAAARLDDLLNLLPARISAGLLLLASIGLGSAGNAWRVLRRDHSLTESPNAGWPMSATAGALGLGLEKIGHYRLGDGQLPEPTAIDPACRLVLSAAAVFTIASALTLWTIR